MGKSRCLHVSLTPKHVSSSSFLHLAPLHLGSLEVSFPDFGLYGPRKSWAGAKVEVPTQLPRQLCFTFKSLQPHPRCNRDWENIPPGYVHAHPRRLKEDSYQDRKTSPWVISCLLSTSQNTNSPLLGAPPLEFIPVNCSMLGLWV